MNQSTAYDLSRFEPRPERVSNGPQLEVVEQSKRSRASMYQVAQVAAVVLVLMAVLCMILYSNATLTELGDQIVSQQKQFDVLVSENQRLSAQLEGRMSLRNIEDTAQSKLGLGKMEPYQVKYVNRSNEDRIIRTAAAPKESVGSKLLGTVGDALEYLWISLHNN